MRVLLTHGSLFTGIGGFDLGFERAGIKTIWQVEIDEYCQRVLARRFPDAKQHSDVRMVGKRNLEWVDILSGGFPCKGFSSATRGRRVAPWLWPPMRRIAQELRPTWLLVENVTHFDGAKLKQMVSEMEADGYEVGPTLEIPACAFGHDHWRPRLWVLGYSHGNSKSRLSVDAEVARMPRGDSYAGRVGKANGIPGRMDRLRMSGNAVIPQIAEWLGKLIIKSGERTRCSRDRAL